ncbi:MAG: response regulator transcription factor [Anaerolineae bacterium]|nr:response regulator transcription factor [Anaerolineae bacterium]
MKKEAENQGRVLIIDDDQNIVHLIKIALMARGFEVLTASDGESGLEIFQTTPPDIVILDVMMPGMDGRQVCQRIRERSNVPLLFLTALGNVPARVQGLAIGADDYMSKPYEVQELIARVEALLRRARLPYESPPKALRFGEGALVINSETHQVFVNSKLVHLTPTEYDLLYFMAKNSGRPLTITAIYNAVWSYESDADPKTVRWYIWRLRQKVEADPDNPQFILTEPGMGYRFSAI